MGAQLAIALRVERFGELVFVSFLQFFFGSPFRNPSMVLPLFSFVCR